MGNEINKIENLRYLSQIFTPSNFNKVVRENDFRLTEKRIKKCLPIELLGRDYKSALETLYSVFKKDYRCEYLYKNNLFNKYLLKQYSLTTTTVLNEFKIGNSIADFVLLNGTSRIFEIKSDLDGLDKLKKQINDYQQFADLIYIVTSTKYVSRILSDYSGSTIGVIEFTQRNTFKEHKMAESNKQFFNYITIFKTLRKQEYLEIVFDNFGYVPDVPNTKIFRICLELVHRIELSSFQKMAFNKLKERKIKCPELLKSEETPIELKQICYALDFTKQEYENLFTFLKKAV
jgi:hypothetical protein